MPVHELANGDNMTGIDTISGCLPALNHANVAYNREGVRYCAPCPVNRFINLHLASAHP